MNNLPVQPKNLLDVLLKLKILDQATVNDIKLKSATLAKSYEQIITENNLASPQDLARAKGELFGVDYIDLSSTPVSPEALNLLPKLVAQKYLLIPFDFDKKNNLLSIAMANPIDLQAIEFVEKKTKTKVKAFIADKQAILSAIKNHYAQSLSVEVTEALKETDVGQKKVKTIDASQVGQIIKEAPIAKIVSTILEFAMKSSASDVHIEPLESKTRVRYRIDGILHEKLVLPKQVHEAVISRIKILSDMKIDEKRIPQDGRFNFKLEDQEVDLRVSSLPSVYGEKIVMRLLKKSGRVPSLPELGVRGRGLKILEDAIHMPHGIVLVTGPTGSGKTTTLYSILSKINTPKVNIITLEDPVEYEIPGVNQVQVNPQAGLTFASGLRSFLRQDPDIIMVGEIRDNETADLAIQASLTGHLVFSTLHTNNAAGAIPRLLDMKAEPFLLASSLTCIVAQRVVRRICKVCKEEYEPPPEVVADIKKVLGPLYSAHLKTISQSAHRPLIELDKLKLYRGKKCAACNNTGYTGRIGVFEILPITEEIARLILERSPSQKIADCAVKNGMVTMIQDGYLKILEGITTVEEVLRVARE